MKAYPTKAFITLVAGPQDARTEYSSPILLPVGVRPPASVTGRPAEPCPCCQREPSTSSRSSGASMRNRSISHLWTTAAPATTAWMEPNTPASVMGMARLPTRISIGASGRCWRDKSGRGNLLSLILSEEVPDCAPCSLRLVGREDVAGVRNEH